MKNEAISQREEPFDCAIISGGGWLMAAEKTISVNVDEKLLNEAVKIGTTDKFDTTDKIVNLAITEFLEKRGKIKELVNMFGTVDYFSDCDYKTAGAK